MGLGVKISYAGAEAPKDSSCANPACNSTKDMFRAAMRTRGTESNTSGPASKKDDKKGDDGASMGRVSKATRIPGCPSDKDTLGAGTWELIHSIAANYPDEPTAKDKQRALDFFNGLAWLYPCPYCAEDFQKEIEASPPQVDSRKTLSLWACDQHNRINTKLGKTTRECSLTALDERFKTGHASCWE